MSAATSRDTPAYPEPSQADHNAQFASVVWFRKQRESGALADYAGKHIAVLGEQIIDADPDPDTLTDRLQAAGETVPPNRVVVQYVPGPDDQHW